MFGNWLRGWTAAVDRRPRAERRRRSLPRRPHAEVLEERRVLSNIVVDIAPTALNMTEGALGSADFVVTRTGGELGHTVTVFYKIGNPGDTAVAQQDYTTSTRQGSLTFGLNETVKHLFIKPWNDSLRELNETVTVRLTSMVVSGGGNGAFVNQVAQLTIIDDDYDPYADVSGIKSVVEGNRRLQFDVELRDASGFRLYKTPYVVVVNYAVSALTPTLNVGKDLNVVGGATGTVTFQPGETRKLVLIDILEDTVVEPEEQFQLDLTGAQNANLSSSSTIDVTIKDDDKALVSIKGQVDPTNESSFEGDSGNTPITFQIVLGNDLERDLNVSYSTFDGTARANDNDYLTVTGQQTFVAGAKFGNVLTVTVQIVGDTKKELTEHFWMKLLPNVLARYARDRVKVSIVNDD